MTPEHGGEAVSQVDVKSVQMRFQHRRAPHSTRNKQSTTMPRGTVGYRGERGARGARGAPRSDAEYVEYCDFTECRGVCGAQWKA